MQEEVNARSVDLREECNKVLQGTPKPINRPRHDHIEASSSGILTESIESRTLITSLRSRDASVPIDLDHGPALALGDLAQLTLLICRGLLVRRDTNVDGRSGFLACGLPDHLRVLSG
jgi:hypothetical protein